MSLQELQYELPEYLGEGVAIGFHPDWAENGSKEISAVVPEADGTVVTGVY